MATHVANYLITEATMIASAVLTSEPIRIEKASAIAVHTQALAGTGVDVGYTYTVSTSADGVYVPGEGTLNATRSVVGVDDCVPEPASFMKLVITNNNGANPVTALRVVLAVQED